MRPRNGKMHIGPRKKGYTPRFLTPLPKLDKELEFHVQKMATYNAESLAEMKRVLWEGTSHWDQLLMDRAEASGKLALSPNTKAALEKFKK